jgi:hypothetical protein
MPGERAVQAFLRIIDQSRFMVRVAKEHGLAVIATLDDVQRLAGRKYQQSRVLTNGSQRRVPDSSQSRAAVENPL